MNKHQLQSQVRTIGIAYLLWFLLGAHYAYLGRWGTQILYWITFGGLGVWALYDLFTMSGKVDRYNAPIFQQMDELDKKEKEEDMARNMTMAAAAAGQEKA
ncbi:TM2 domain-containing protein [Salibacteraceae bacterium]|jgi:TM2 domain-containing membrane protein YozV|nr:TM2 domain-containing protein [Salibacteraceae bacterium]